LRTKEHTFEWPFLNDMDEYNDNCIYYHKEGHYSTTMEISNPILQYSGSEDLYYEFHHNFLNILKILGENYILQKQDIFFDAEYKGKQSDDFLSQKYFEHFEFRKYKDVKTYLTITRKIKRSNFFTYNKKAFDDFLIKIRKVSDVLKEAKFKPNPLTKRETTFLLKRFKGFSFDTEIIKFDNYFVGDTDITTRNKHLKIIPLIDIDEVNFPNKIKPYSTENLGYKFPVDLFSFIANVPDVETLIYNQVISIPNQKQELMGIEKKKKKHSSMPDPANEMAITDIDNALAKIAQDNDLLIHSHCSFMLFGTEDANVNASNYIDQALFKLGITPSSNSYNQWELFKGSMSGNATVLQYYDLFKITLEPATCLFYKENKQSDEDSKVQIHFTDRKGIPVAIDPLDLPMTTNRISNRNKFILGPSGTGKSFLVNDIIRQYYLLDMDIVIIDVGHSYSGLNQYYNGRYVTYSEDEPITMNPFKLKKGEYNEEKRQFLKSLIILLWKGDDGSVTQTEDTAITNVIFNYYRSFYNGQNQDENITEDYLSFNSFYEFSIIDLERISREEEIIFDVKSYRFILKKFYKGGEYDTILNSDVDSTLFDEKFIVFEIDAIKDNKLLFPITTLIIMDVFIQKMRLKKNRKALFIEEAWKAIASPIMAPIIVYLYKTVRKFWGEIAVVTQELEDIISNEIVKNSIISNSDTLILLEQTKFRENYDQVAELLNISQVERNKIFTINQLDNKKDRNRFKEFYIKRGETGEVYGAEVSIYQYLTYTTEKKEKDALSTYTTKYGSYKDGLNSFVNDLQISGLNLSDFTDNINASNKQSIAV